MSVTPTVAPTPASTLTHRGLADHFWLGSLLTLPTAVVMNTLIALAAHGLFPVTPSFVPLQVASVIPATVVAVTGALLVLAGLRRWTQNPARRFRRIAGAVLLLSIIPDLLLLFVRLYPDTTLPEVGSLLLMHGATAALCIGMAFILAPPSHEARADARS